MGEWASATEHARAMCPLDPKSRRRCDCGCGQRATHHGCANGLALLSGCELFIRRWVRDPGSTLQCVWCQRPLVAHAKPCAPLTNRQMKALRLARRTERAAIGPTSDGGAATLEQEGDA